MSGSPQKDAGDPDVIITGVEPSIGNPKTSNNSNSTGSSGNISSNEGRHKIDTNSSVCLELV